MNNLSLRQKTTITVAVPIFLLGLFILGFSRHTFKTHLQALKQNEIKQLVLVAKQEADLIVEKSKRENLDVNKELLKKFSQTKFDGSNYFFIYDFNGVNISHVKDSLVGKNLFNFKDKGGVLLIQELVKAAKSKNNGGFVEYFWPSKEDAEKIVPKLGYSHKIEGVDYFIGSGVYLNEVDEIISSFFNTILFSFLICGFLITAGILFFMKRQVIDPIHAVSKRLKETGHSLKSQSHEISNTSDNLASSTTELSASLDETAAAVIEIDSMIQRTLERSKMSESSSKKSAEIVDHGANIVSDMMAAINNIATTNEDVTSKMESSSAKIQEILGHIQNIELKTSVINDIVFQTKLLSFNASVEAARAGDQGKGFAVVAEEVGSLAVMSGKSASEITDILSQSIIHVQANVEQTQKDIKDIIEVTEKSLKHGLAVAEENRNALHEIRDHVNNVIEQITEIVDASEEQSKGVSEINTSIKSLDSIAKINLESSQNAKAISEELQERTKDIESNLLFLDSVINGKKAA